jgi:hypothetical protein
MWWNMKTIGSTYENLAWALIPLAQYLAIISLPFGLWIVGDDTYPSSEYFLSPYSIQASRAEKIKNNFNFYQSRCRINVECAFGMLVEKFGVLMRSQSTRLKHTVKVISVCIKLHNLGVDNGVYMVLPMARDLRAHDSMLHVRQDVVSLKPNHLKNRVKSTLRDEISEVLKAQGFARPVANRKRLRGD